MLVSNRATLPSLHLNPGSAASADWRSSRLQESTAGFREQPCSDPSTFSISHLYALAWFLQADGAGWEPPAPRVDPSTQRLRAASPDACSPAASHLPRWTCSACWSCPGSSAGPVTSCPRRRPPPPTLWTSDLGCPWLAVGRGIFFFFMLIFREVAYFEPLGSRVFFRLKSCIPTLSSWSCSEKETSALGLCALPPRAAAARVGRVRTRPPAVGTSRQGPPSSSPACEPYWHFAPPARYRGPGPFSDRTQQIGGVQRSCPVPVLPLAAHFPSSFASLCAQLLGALHFPVYLLVKRPGECGELPSGLLGNVVF